MTDAEIRAALEDALEVIAAVQPAALERLRADGVVFDEMPHHDPSNWQQVAFWIYTDLCRVEAIASIALATIRLEDENEGIDVRRKE